MACFGKYLFDLDDIFVAMRPCIEKPCGCCVDVLPPFSHRRVFWSDYQRLELILQIVRGRKSLKKNAKGGIGGATKKCTESST